MVSRSNFVEFCFPNAPPIADVAVAIILSFLSIGLKKYFKL